MTQSVIYLPFTRRARRNQRSPLNLFATSLNMERTAIYAGSFDPLTLGHANIIERGLELFDDIVVAIAINVNKKPMFTLDERLAFIDQAYGEGSHVQAVAFEGLLVDYARTIGAKAILRGLRNQNDFEYELKLASMNHHLAPDIETAFLLTRPEQQFVSSSLIKEVASFGGDVSAFLMPHVEQALRARLAETSS